MHRKFRWSQVYESSEEELVDFLKARNIESQRIQIEAGDELVERYVEAQMTLWCAEGSLTLAAGSTTVSLQPGDAVRLQAHMTYAIRPGITGCVYYQS